MSPLEALRAVTTEAAEFMGLDGEIAAFSPGARADLVLVEGDPGRGVGVLRHPAGVTLRGAWLERP